MLACVLVPVFSLLACDVAQTADTGACKCDALKCDVLSCSTRRAPGRYGRAFPPCKIPDHVSAATYAFLDLRPNESGHFVPTLSDPWADTDKRFPPGESVEPVDADGEPYYGCLNQFRKIKAKRPFEFSLSIGGWTFSRNFSDAVATPQAREAFVNSLMGLFRRFPGLIDALDFDWEYISPEGQNYGNGGNVVRKDDGANFVEFLGMLRAALSAANLSHVKLTCAVTAAPNKMSALPVEAMNAVIDEFRLMTYDYASSAWGPCRATHQTNLYPSRSGHTPYSIQGSVAAYTARGVPPAKILIGAALYSRGFANTDGLGAPANGVVKNKSWEDGVSDYKVLPVPGARELWDDECKAAYCYDPQTRDLNSYDNPRSIAEKARFVHEQGLGGLFFWEISGDKLDEPKRSLSRCAWELLEAGDSSLDKASKACVGFIFLSVARRNLHRLAYRLRLQRDRNPREKER